MNLKTKSAYKVAYYESSYVGFIYNLRFYARSKGRTKKYYNVSSYSFYEHNLITGTKVKIEI
jgi:hypothetical protein